MLHAAGVRRSIIIPVHPEVHGAPHCERPACSIHLLHTWHDTHTKEHAVELIEPSGHLQPFFISLAWNQHHFCFLLQLLLPVLPLNRSLSYPSFFSALLNQEERFYLTYLFSGLKSCHTCKLFIYSIYT